MNNRSLHRTWPALILALCMLLSALPAQAAPARELQALEMTVDEKMQLLIRIADESIPEECYDAAAGQRLQTLLIPGEEPSADLAAQALWAAILLARETTHLSWEEAERLYSQVFTEGTLPLSRDQKSPFLTLTEDGVDAEPVRSPDHGGAHVYSVTFDGTNVTVLYDEYFCEHDGGESVDEMPEDLVTWTANVCLSLRYAPETEFGYTVNGISLSPSYQDGLLSRWTDTENTEYEYSLKLPSTLGLADDDPAHRVWQNADGTVTLTVTAREKTAGGSGYDQAYAALVAKNRAENLGLTIVREADFSRFYAVGDGLYQLNVLSDDLSWDYELTLSFPPERQAEYELYAEFIRNSLIMWGIANG
ncbi:MAG: hypothetical protein IKP32_05530 [Clostridia bacterium]|nr:hypothetical protein [Clostridia bacterium]